LVQTPVLEKTRGDTVCRENSEELPAWRRNRMEPQGTDRASGVTRDNVVSWLTSVPWTPVSKGRKKDGKCAIRGGRTVGENCGGYLGLEEVSCNMRMMSKARCEHVMGMCALDWAAVLAGQPLRIP